MFETVAEMKGPFMVKALNGPVLYTGFNLAGVKFALKKVVGTVDLVTKNFTLTLPVADALALAGAL